MCETRGIQRGRFRRFEYQLSLGSKMYLSNALSMLNRNLTRFVQSLFSVQSICTVRKGSACRVPPNPLNSRRRRQHNVGSPGYVMRNRPRPSLNRSDDGGVALKVLVLKVIPWYCIAHPYCARFSRHQRAHMSACTCKT